ncbi:MAG TPA: hypothetical protein VJ757_07460 [Pseudonocardiaceae bacterium]|nr:hypothetical protein [Pseudonocardiaceae bacterium]
MGNGGRVCPLWYRYRADDLAGPATLQRSTLYVVGCLYGNTEALRAILDRAAGERATVVFNGDFHWLDTDIEEFRAIAEAVAGHHATLGNVEAELINPSGDNGCGCAYPDYIDDRIVTPSNTIASRLRATALQIPELVGLLANLPRYLVAEVAGQRVGVLHGDPESLGLTSGARSPGTRRPGATATVEQAARGTLAPARTPQ